MKNKIPGSADLLIIKKEAEKNVVFHYDRAARLTLKKTPEIESRPKKSIFRRISHSKILLINILLVILIIVGVNLLRNQGKASAEIAGYKAQLSAFKVHETLYAFVHFKKAAGTEPAATGTAQIIFRLKKSRKEIVQKLDWQDSGDKEVKMTLPVDAADTAVETLITVGNKTISLFKNIDR